MGVSEAPPVDVAGVWLTHKVGEPWHKETDREMPYQFGVGFQELAEVSEVSTCEVSYMDWSTRVPCCANNALHRGTVFSAPGVSVDKPQQSELKVDGEMVPKGEYLIQVTDTFTEFWQGVGTGGGILATILMNTGDPGERLSCSLGMRLSLTWSQWLSLGFFKGKWRSVQNFWHW